MTPLEEAIAAVLQSLQAGIEISYVSFEGGSQEPDQNTLRLIEAIEDARLVQASPSRRAYSKAGADAEG